MSLASDDFESLKLKNQLCFPFYAAARLIVQAYQPMLNALGGITYPQYLVLIVLWEKDGQNVKEISDKLFLDSGTLTPVLKKLQDTGLIVRKRSVLDDRSVLNFLTEAGKALKPLALQHVIELFCTTGMSIDDATKIKESTNSLIKVLLSNTLSQTPFTSS